MPDEIKKCPFCGGEPVVTLRGNDYTEKRSATIKCKSCRFEVTHAARTFDVAWCEAHCWKSWNRRSSISLETAQKLSDALDMATFQIGAKGSGECANCKSILDGNKGHSENCYVGKALSRFNAEKGGQG